MNILILFYTILYLILAKIRLNWAIILIIIVLPSYLIRFKIFGLPLTVLELMIWLAFLTWLIFHTEFRNYVLEKGRLKRFRQNRAKRIAYPFGWEVILLLVVSFVAAAVSGFSLSALGIWKAYFFEPVLFFILILNIFGRDKKELNSKALELSSCNKILWALAISAFAISMLAIYQKITGQLIDNMLWAAAETRRVVSFFGYPNAMGLYLGQIVLVMIGWFASVILKPKAEESLVIPHNSSNKLEAINGVNTFLPGILRYAQDDKVKIIFVGLVIILSLLSIYFAKSKGALIGVAAGLVVFGILAGKKIRVVTVAVLLVAAIFIAAYQPAQKVFIETITFNNVSGQIRKAGWAESWEMLKDGRFISGAGLANYQTIIKPYHQEGIFIKNDDPNWLRKVLFNDEYRKKAWQPLEIYLYPHNIFLNFWSELGLAGMLLFIWIMGKYFYVGIRILSLRGASANANPSPPTGGSGQASQSHERNDQRLLRSSSTGSESLAMTDKFLAIGLIGAMVVIIVHGLVDVPYFKNDLAMMFWLFIAMMSLVNLEINNQTKIKYGK